MDKKRPSWTFALEVMMAATQNLERTECHGTATGVRAVVVHDGQLYEILVNPLHQYSQIHEELGNGGEPIPALVNEDGGCER